MEPARTRRQHRRHESLVRGDQAEQCAPRDHRDALRCRNARVIASVKCRRSSANGIVAAAGPHWITYHRAGVRASDSCSSDLQRRRIRLRVTALPTFFVMMIPTLGCAVDAPRGEYACTVMPEAVAATPRRIA